MTITFEALQFDWYDWSYFWTVWKRCAIHGDIPCPHDYFEHLELFEYSDKKVRQIPNVSR